jgi:peptidyl-prolyl cis-trans isomerase B (cyclophilin B)
VVRLPDEYHAWFVFWTKELLMMKTFTGLFVALLFSSAISTQAQESMGNPGAIIHTNMGDITLELFADKAPISVENFINYANNGSYDETIFHRVISHFMIQGGGFDINMEKRPTAEPINNEAGNGLSNSRGTIAMARTGHPHSATSQFFINTQDNQNLDHTSENNSRSWGYAVFGKVTAGMETVDSIRFVETEPKPPHANVPTTPVVIESVEIVAAK